MKLRKICIFLSLLLFISLGVKPEERLVPRLSPLPTDMKGNSVSLNGTWKFNPAPPAGFYKETNPPGSDIEVPGEWVMQGFYVEKGKGAGYSRTFTLPDTWKNRRIKLRCNGVFSESTIYVNGEKSGYHLGGFTPFEIDITSAVTYGQSNTIALEVVSESVADSAASASRYAVHPLGGITRDIFVFALPDVNLSSFHAGTHFDSSYTNGVLTAEVEVSNETDKPRNNLSLLYTLTDASGKQVALKNNKQALPELTANSRQAIQTSFGIDCPEQWNPEHPYLYTFTCELKEGGKTIHTTVRRIGFRQVEVRGNELFVNNKPVKLRGVCRHEVMPLRGRSVTGDTWRKDVELFRDANVNYIRTSHYPPDEALLEACDELGMFVEMEAPFCWAHETKVPEEKHFAVLVNQHLEMVNRDKSHPSVIIWSLGNESNLYAEYFRKAGELIKEIDPSRPRIFSQWSPDSDNGELEIANHHYPGPEGPNMYRNSKRPVVFDEFCHLNAYNRLELAADPGLRSMWGKLLDQMWDTMYKSKGVLGGALWAGIDDTFFLPGGIAVGYGTWGPIDGWRREKPEYWEMKKAFSPVRIRQKSNTTENGTLLFDVENRSLFTNLSAYDIRWKTGGKEGTVNVDVAPRANGSFEISLPEELRNNEELEIEVHSPQGFVADIYTFRVRPAYRAVVPVKKAKITWKETAQSMQLSSPRGGFSVDKRDGSLRIMNPQGQLLTQESPVLMLLPLNQEGEGIQMTGKDQRFQPYNPVCSNWICETIEKKEDETGVHIHIKGTYDEAGGEFIYSIGKDGALSLSYDFEVKQNVNPRQTGIVFTFPESFGQLTWKREGYWNYYPSDHVAALSGSAFVLDNEQPVSGIAGPDKVPSAGWSSDQTANGTNMFRSTKENIKEAALSEVSGKQFSVLSDGSQHIRAWKDNRFIWLLIADYNNPGSERFFIPHAQKYYKPLREGDRVSGTICFSM